MATRNLSLEELQKELEDRSKKLEEERLAAILRRNTEQAEHEAKMERERVAHAEKLKASEEMWEKRRAKDREESERVKQKETEERLLRETTQNAIEAAQRETEQRIQEFNRKLDELEVAEEKQRQALSEYKSSEEVKPMSAHLRNLLRIDGRYEQP